MLINLRYCTDTIWEGLENAASIVVKDTAVATQTFIHHRYGADAGEVAKEAGAAVVGVTTTAINLKRVGVKPFVTATAKAALREHVAGGDSVADRSTPSSSSSSSTEAAPVAPPRKQLPAASASPAL